MINLDSILKGRDITLPTNVHLVKVKFSLVVMIFFWAPKSLQMVAEAMKLKNDYFLEEKL